MKNDYEIRGDVTAIILISPKYGRLETLISTSQLQRANEFENRWYPRFHKCTQSFYVQGVTPRSNGKYKSILMHRWITNAPEGVLVDHKNHNTLDNTDSNLRFVSHAENLQNRKGANKGNKSGARGVYWHKEHKKWQGQVILHSKRIHVGYFKTFEECVAAVKDARNKHLPFSIEESAVPQESILAAARGIGA